MGAGTRGEPKSRPAPVARQLSVRNIMGAILHQGPASRAALAKITGLSRQTSTQVVLELEREGWLRPRGRVQGPVGRSAPTYELNPDAAFVVGIRLEGSVVQLAIANIRGEVLAEASEPTSPTGGYDVVRQVGRLFGQLLATGGVERDKVRLCAMGSPGVVDPRTGGIDIAPSIPHLSDINFVAALREELQVELSIENGVKLAALGEFWRGSARGVQSFGYFAVGSGVGMGIVSGGRLLRGANGAAGEIAYLPIGGPVFTAEAPQNGTFEAAANSVALVERFVARGGPPGCSVAEIFARFDAGEAPAVAAIDETARVIALGIAAANAVLDLELVVLGGSLGSRPQLAERIIALLPALTALALPIRVGMLGTRATLVGALGDAHNRLHRELFGVDALASPAAAGKPALEGALQMLEGRG